MTELIERPGLEGVVAGTTAISSIDQGLRYRGYAIEDLAQNSTFEEVSFLILNGQLPTATELSEWTGQLAAATEVPQAIFQIVRDLPPTASLMDVMRTGASLLGIWDAEPAQSDSAALVRKAQRLIGGLPVILAAACRSRAGQHFVPSRTDLSLAANLLWMLRDQVPDTQAARALDVTLILYAEHEYNASTFTSRVIASTLSDLYSAVTGAIGALKGPLHGGANERVMDVLTEIGTSDRAEKWIRDTLARKQRIMGFGHRVYKTGDPRARYLKTWCAELARQTGHDDLERLADVVERVVAEQKGLPPNLDWPSARLYYYLGLPIELYTPLFVVSRVAGWSAHVLEQLGDNRIIRPRSRYTGPAARSWLPLNQRS